MNFNSIFAHAALKLTSPTVEMIPVRCHCVLGISVSKRTSLTRVSEEREAGSSSFPQEQKRMVERTAMRRLTAPLENQWGG